MVQSRIYIGDFGPLGRENDAFTSMNNWYFGSFGRNAFIDGRVPSKFSNNSLIQRVNAMHFYEKAMKLDGNFSVEKWGSGGLLDSPSSFLDCIEELDELNRTEIYKGLRYTISDISKKCIDQAKHTNNRHANSGVLCFETKDVTKPSLSHDVSNIESSYLYDSISQPVIAKVNGKFYEIHFRPYFDLSDLHSLDGTYIEPEVFVHWLKRNRFGMLATVSPESFSGIKLDQKLVEINIESYPNGYLIKEILDGIDDATMPTAETHIESIQHGMDSLREGGYFQTFDLGITKIEDIKRSSNFIGRYGGSIYLPVNFLIIENIMKRRGYSVVVENISDYVSRVLGHNLFPSHALALVDENLFDKIFPLDLMKEHDKIKKTADRIQSQKGYCHAGRIEFYRDLKRAGLLEWCDESWYDMFTRNEGYIQDMRFSLMRHIQAYFGFDGWVHERSTDRKFHDYMDELGFEKGIVDHFFSHRKEISQSTNYNHMMIEK